MKIFRKVIIAIIMCLCLMFCLALGSKSKAEENITVTFDMQGKGGEAPAPMNLPSSNVEFKSELTFPFCDYGWSVSTQSDEMKIDGNYYFVGWSINTDESGLLSTISVYTYGVGTYADLGEVRVLHAIWKEIPLTLTLHCANCDAIDGKKLYGVSNTLTASDDIYSCSLPSDLAGETEDYYYQVICYYRDQQLTDALEIPLSYMFDDDCTNDTYTGGGYNHTAGNVDIYADCLVVNKKVASDGKLVANHTDNVTYTWSKVAKNSTVPVYTEPYAGNTFYMYAYKGNFSGNVVTNKKNASSTGANDKYTYSFYLEEFKPGQTFTIGDSNSVFASVEVTLYTDTLDSKTNVTGPYSYTIPAGFEGEYVCVEYTTKNPILAVTATGDFYEALEGEEFVSLQNYNKDCDYVGTVYYANPHKLKHFYNDARTYENIQFTATFNATTNHTGEIHSHELEKIAFVNGTCDDNGHYEYYKCKTCGKYYMDSNAKNQITDFDGWIVSREGLIPQGYWYEDFAVKASDASKILPGGSINVGNATIKYVAEKTAKGSIDVANNAFVFDLVAGDDYSIDFTMGEESYIKGITIEFDTKTTVPQLYGNGWTLDGNKLVWANGFATKVSLPLYDNMKFTSKQITITVVRPHNITDVITYDKTNNVINSELKCQDCGKEYHNGDAYMWAHKVGGNGNFTEDELYACATGTIPFEWDPSTNSYLCNIGSDGVLRLTLDLSKPVFGLEFAPGDEVEFVTPNAGWRYAETKVISGGTLKSGSDYNSSFTVILTDTTLVVDLRDGHCNTNGIMGFNVKVEVVSDLISTTDTETLSSPYVEVGKAYTQVAFYDTANGRYAISNTIVVPDPNACEHVGQKVNKVDSTCCQTGHKEYWKCSNCGTCFTDEALTNEIADIDAWLVGDGVIDLIDHNGIFHAQENATCIKEGHYGYYQCDMCNKAWANSSLTNAIADLDAWLAGDGKIGKGIATQEIIVTAEDFKDISLYQGFQYGDEWFVVIKGITFYCTGYYGNAGSIKGDGEYIYFDLKGDGGADFNFHTEYGKKIVAMEAILEDGVVNNVITEGFGGMHLNGNVFSYDGVPQTVIAQYMHNNSHQFTAKTKQIKFVIEREHEITNTIWYDDTAKAIKSQVKCKDCGHIFDTCENYKWYHKLGTTTLLTHEQVLAVATANYDIEFDEYMGEDGCEKVHATDDLLTITLKNVASIGDTVKIEMEDAEIDTAETKIVSGATGTVDSHCITAVLDANEFTFTLVGDSSYIWFTITVITADDPITTTDKQELKNGLEYGKEHLMVATLNGKEIVSNIVTPIEGQGQPGPNDGPAPQEPKKQLDVEVTNKDGSPLPDDIELVVEISISSKRTDAVLKTETKVDKKEITTNKEKIAVVYDVKLYREIGGVKTEIQPSDIAPGTILLIKMELPAKLKVNSITKLLHFHGDGSYDIIDEFSYADGYIMFETDSLSEFAIVVKDSACAAHWLILLFFILYIVAIFLILLFANDRKEFGKKKEDKEENKEDNKEEANAEVENTEATEAPAEEKPAEEENKEEEPKEEKKRFALTGADFAIIVADVVFALLIVVGFIIKRCAFCIVLLVISILVLVAVTALWFLRKPIQEKRKEAGKEESKIEQFINAAPLSASMEVAAPVEDKDFTKENIAEYLTKRDDVILNRRENYAAGGKLPLADTHYFKYTNEKGKEAKECFIYVYEMNDDRKLIIIKADEETIAPFKEKHEVEISRFPVGGKWYSLPIDETYKFVEVTELIDAVLAKLADNHKVETAPAEEKPVE